MSASFRPHRSAALPVTSGTMAPPTMAMQMTPEPSAARLPKPSLASVKIVGNMMELKHALIVPAVCYLTILSFGWFARRPLQAAAH